MKLSYTLKWHIFGIMSTDHTHNQTVEQSNGPGEDMGLLTEYLSESNPKPTQSAEAGTLLNEEIEHLRSLLSADHDELNFEDVLALLDNADGVASGVENKLDEMLDTLDGLLSKLERNPRSTDGDPPTDSTVPSPKNVSSTK